MRVGFDLDGVLADFVTPYQQAFINTTGRDDFEPGDIDNPPCWDWPKLRGYTSEETRVVWGGITTSQTFWYGLRPTDHVETLAMLVPELEHLHDIYYITSRPGLGAKRQTEAWLTRYLPYQELGVSPSVLIVGHMKKGAAANALGLDCYIDDNRDNAIDVACKSQARSYLLDRAYNQGSLPRGNVRVSSLSAFFDCELDNL